MFSSPEYTEKMIIIVAVSDEEVFGKVFEEVK